MNLKLPEHFTEVYDDIMSNFDGMINQPVVEAIKGKELFSRYSGWNFNGRVWWDGENQKWCCEIWVYGARQKTLMSNDLEEIMTDVCDQYGYD